MLRSGGRRTGTQPEVRQITDRRRKPRDLDPETGKSGGGALSLAGSLARSRLYRAALAKELKKQLAPGNRKLDELEKQNEELKKQNEHLKKQLK